MVSVMNLQERRVLELMGKGAKGQGEVKQGKRAGVQALCHGAVVKIKQEEAYTAPGRAPGTWGCPWP